MMNAQEWVLAILVMFVVMLVPRAGRMGDRLGAALSRMSSRVKRAPRKEGDVSGRSEGKPS